MSRRVVSAWRSRRVVGSAISVASLLTAAQCCLMLHLPRTLICEGWFVDHPDDEDADADAAAATADFAVRSRVRVHPAPGCVGATNSLRAKAWRWPGR